MKDLCELVTVNAEFSDDMPLSQRTGRYRNAKMHEPGDLPYVCTESETALNAASNRQYGFVLPLLCARVSAFIVMNHAPAFGRGIFIFRKGGFDHE